MSVSMQSLTRIHSPGVLSHQNQPEDVEAGRGEVPWPLWRAWGIVIVGLLISGTIALEIMLASSKKSQGSSLRIWLGSLDIHAGLLVHRLDGPGMDHRHKGLRVVLCRT